jgi:hypothetical protein
MTEGAIIFGSLFTLSAITVAIQRCPVWFRALQKHYSTLRHPRNRVKNRKSDHYFIFFFVRFGVAL